MRKTTKWARVAIVVVAIAKVLATPWGAAMTALVAIAGAVGLWFADWRNVQYVLASLAVFVGIIWGAAGMVWLGTRSEPQIVKADRDYAYGLTFEGLSPYFNPDNPESFLGFGIHLRNYSPGPLRYTVEEFDVRIGRKALPRVKKGFLTSIMSRGSARISSTEPFIREDIESLLGKKTEGTVDFSITYGHPEDPPVRRLKMGLGISLDFTKAGEMGFGAPIKTESDAAI